MTEKSLILVADDEKPIRDIISYQLKKEQYDVLTAENGQKALDLIKRNPVNLLILDLMMPGINGYDVIRNAPKSLPIIIVSAKDDVNSKIVALEMGADDYLSKPFSKIELLARIHTCLRERKLGNINKDEVSHSSNEVLHLGDLEININNCLVKENGKTIDISKTEFKLLELFAKHPKKVYTKEELLDKVWGTDFFGDTRTVHMAIYRLRQKIQDKDVLMTKRGFGYYGKK